MIRLAAMLQAQIVVRIFAGVLHKLHAMRNRISCLLKAQGQAAAAGEQVQHFGQFTFC